MIEYYTVIRYQIIGYRDLFGRGNDIRRDEVESDIICRDRINPISDNLISNNCVILHPSNQNVSHSLQKTANAQ